MALNPIGVLDLSIITDLLIKTVDDYWPSSALWSTLFSDAFFKPAVSGLTPEAVRTGEGCQVTISLIHIEPSKSQRNFVFTPPAPVSGPLPPPPLRAQKIPALPLGLDLYYFVTAFSLGNYQQEQQAISIIMNCFHQNPILRKTVVFPGSPSEAADEEFTLTMEIESVDSISRLWQAITAPFRLSVMYRVAVVFLTPPAPPPPAKQVLRYGLAVEPASFPFATRGQVFGSSSQTTYLSPERTPAKPVPVTADYSPATVTPGQRFFLLGSGLNQGTDYTGPAPNTGTSHRTFLMLPPDFTAEQEVTAWMAPDTDPHNPIQTAARIVLDVPAALGPLPGGSPVPGVYALRAGSNKPADSDTYRTNSTPFNVAARVDVPGLPPNPILALAGGQYSVSGMGFLAGNTEVLLDTIPLTAVALPPLGAGQFVVASNTSIQFKAPALLNAGLYTVRIRVNGIESPPALWIQV
jgi:hypothetical protein